MRLQRLRFVGLASGVFLTLAAWAPLAHATEILSFSKTGSSGNGFTVTETGSSTSLSVVNDLINIGLILGGSPTNAYLDLSATSTDAAKDISGEFLQNYSGTFSITSGMGGTGTNYLSGSFVDLLSGALGGFGLSLSASTPPSTNVSFTSSVIPGSDLGVERSMALGLTNLSSAVAISHSTLASTTASVAGNFSADLSTVPVPEPNSLAMFAVGLLSLGMLWYSRRRAL